jgi:hypothetical protein
VCSSDATYVGARRPHRRRRYRCVRAAVRHHNLAPTSPYTVHTHPRQDVDGRTTGCDWTRPTTRSVRVDAARCPPVLAAQRRARGQQRHTCYCPRCHQPLPTTARWWAAVRTRGGDAMDTASVHRRGAPPTVRSFLQHSEVTVVNNVVLVAARDAVDHCPR